jgi:8-oxo-dGTP pyrophosphatase MutT (NUDIX family)
MSHIFNAELRETLALRLGGFERIAGTEGTLKRAAVAITVVPHEGGAGFLLTRRAPRLASHASQWALPGGRLDPGESVVDAALRELEEEVALRVSPADVLGQLDDYPTRSGYLIAPLVVWAEDIAAMTPNPGEVASIHPFPLAELERPDSPIFFGIPESDKPVIRLLLGDSHVHAPTAAVLYQFAEVALRNRPTRVAGYEQPVWAWK